MCFTYLQDGEAARAVVLRALKAGIPRRNVLAVRADVADEAAMELAFDAAESLGRVEVLVNNARLGGHDRRSPFRNHKRDPGRRPPCAWQPRRSE